MADEITFWEDNPNLITTECCYVGGCNERTSGGGSRDKLAITLCSQHRTAEGYEDGAAQLRSWKT